MPELWFITLRIIHILDNVSGANLFKKGWPFFHYTHYYLNNLYTFATEYFI